MSQSAKGVVRIELGIHVMVPLLEREGEALLVE
jgi:hypothetical protein